MGAPRVLFLNFSETPGAIYAGSLIPLGENEKHYLINVLRLSENSEIYVRHSNPTVRIALNCKLCKSSDSFQLEVTNYDKDPQINPPVISTLIFGLCKGDKNELVIEKCTELGVANFIFFEAERSVSRLGDASKIEKKLSRFEKIALSASQQSGRLHIPSVSMCESLNAALTLLKDTIAYQGPKYCLALSPNSLSFSELTEAKSSGVILAVGPEGDFSPGEYELLFSEDFIALRICETILRSETAAIASVASFTTFNYKR